MINGNLDFKNNLLGVNPLFATAGLAENGGPTETIALQADSPAVGGGLIPRTSSPTSAATTRGPAPAARISGYQHNATADTTPPTASLSAPGVTTSNASSLTPYVFTIAYTDKIAVAGSSVPGTIVEVSPPGATSRPDHRDVISTERPAIAVVF